jgi:hypothetical protein
MARIPSKVNTKPQDILRFRSHEYYQLSPNVAREHMEVFRQNAACIRRTLHLHAPQAL